jgi:hypothetical protein
MGELEYSGEMEKDFDGWNVEKKKTHYALHAPFCHEREVWWCALGINIGYEQDGTGKNFDRPVAVLRVFNTHMFFGVVLTGKRRQDAYHHPESPDVGRPEFGVVSRVGRKSGDVGRPQIVVVLY